MAGAALGTGRPADRGSTGAGAPIAPARRTGRIARADAASVVGSAGAALGAGSDTGTAAGAGGAGMGAGGAGGAGPVALA